MNDLGPEAGHATVLERLDLLLAERLADRAAEDSDAAEVAQELRSRSGPAERHRFVAAALNLRGYGVDPDDVRAIEDRRPGRFGPDHQETRLAIGLSAVFQRTEERVARGHPVDGWALVDAFRRMTGEVARFRNNSLRRDLPWDALPDVRYPEPDRLQGLVDAFHAANHYGDRPEVFADLHPVRQAVRMFWRIGRIAPFPDFNLSMAFLTMNAHLRLNGYPLFVAEPGDRRRFQDLIRAAVPQRSLLVEQRLLTAVEP